MPRRILYYPNIVKAEGRGKSKTLFLILGYAEAASYIIQIYEKPRAETNIKTPFLIFGYAEAASYNIIQIYEKPRAEANQKHCF